MAKPTINSNNPIWANGTDNKNANFTNEEITQGIVKQSDIVSNQLNGMAFRADTFIDNLQRCTAWNPNKTYEIGDNVFVNVSYQKSGDSGATSYLCFFRCNQAANTNTPLMQGTATAFNVNTDTNVPLFTIQSGNNTTHLTSFVNTGWVMLDLTNADLNNATRLSVTGATTLNGATTINNTLSTTGATTLKSTLNVGGHSTLASLGVQGATTLTGNLTSNGTTYTKNISTEGTHTISSTLTANGATNLNSTLAVKGATTLTGNLTSNGTTYTKNLQTNGWHNVTGALTTNGATTLKSTLAVTGKTTMTGGFTSNAVSYVTTPALTTTGTEVVTSNWWINKLKSIQVITGVGKKTWSFIIDMSKASNPANCITLDDDAKGLTAEQLRVAMGIKPVLFVNGAQKGDLNLNNYTLLTTGASSGVTTLGNDAMLYVPRMGIYMRSEGSLIKCSFTNDTDAKNYYQYYAHQRGATEKDAFYYGCYKASESGSKIYSASGKSPRVNATIGNFRTWARARGTGYDQVGFYQRQFMQALYILLYQTLDSQTKHGRGRDSGNAVIATGGSDTWGFHGDNTPAASKTSGTTNVKCLGVEDFWGNCWEWLDGVVTINYSVHTATDGFNDAGAGYINQGIACYAGYQESYITSIAGNNGLMFYPTGCNGGSQSTYFCDCFWQGATCVAKAGSGWYDGFGVGACALTVDNASSYTSADAGSRLMFL